MQLPFDHKMHVIRIIKHQEGILWKHKSLVANLVKIPFVVSNTICIDVFLYGGKIEMNIDDRDVQ